MCRDFYQFGEKVNISETETAITLAFTKEKLALPASANGLLREVVRRARNPRARRTHAVRLDFTKLSNGRLDFKVEDVHTYSASLIAEVRSKLEWRKEND